MNKNSIRVLLVGLSSFVMASVHAASNAVDVTTVVSTITDQLIPIGLVGAAVLSVVVAVKSFKWVRASMA